MGETEQAMSRRYGVTTREGVTSAARNGNGVLTCEFPEETPLVTSAARNGNG
jgi:hypothetical protein